MRRTLIEIWRLLDPRQKRRLVLLQFVSLFMALSTVASIASVMPFFAVLAEPQSIHDNRWLALAYEQSGMQSDRSFMVLLGVGVVLLIVGSSMLNLLGGLAMTRFAFWVGNDFQITLFSEYLDRDYLFHARTNSAKLVNNTTAQVDRITRGILMQAVAFTNNLIISAAIVTAILIVNPKIALGTALVLGGAYGVIYMLVRRKLADYGQRQSLAGASRMKALSEGFGGIKEIIVLRSREVFRHEFQRNCWEIARVQANAQILAVSPKYLLEGIAVGGLVTVALVLSGGSGGVTWLAEITFLGLAAYRLMPSLQWCFQEAATMRANRSALEDLAADLRNGRETLRREASARSKSPGSRIVPSRSLEVDGVCFRYAEDRPLVLDGIRLSIVAGSTVGFVGPSGSGKTTLADVILGLLVPESGQILVDGTPIDDRSRNEWQRGLAYVPQNIFLTDGSIAENIAFGVPRHLIDHQRLLESARLARLDEFVESLEHGFDEVIGERGVRLSGGQRQRIGIARALYRDAAVLVFDEATSALDGVTEQEVMQAIEGLHGHRTIILIAHRLTTVRNCDAIFEFENGKVARNGTYEELLATSERFRRMAGVSHPAPTS
jgi:ABC-type multidrug transport system fused ATPase/permease subunit